MFTDSPALIEFTKTALRIYAACLLLFGIQIACQMTFTSLGNAKASILVAVMRKFILLIPLIYILPAIFTQAQTTAVYAAEPVADFLAVSFTAVLFTFQFRKSLAGLPGGDGTEPALPRKIRRPLRCDPCGGGYEKGIIWILHTKPNCRSGKRR